MARNDNKSKTKKKAAKKKTGGGGKKKKQQIIKEKMYGEREFRHHAIMLMSEEDLHEEYPFTTELVFNETMTKKEFDESAVPDESCLFGVKPDGKQHRFVIGNEQGEILPRFLNAKWIMIESGKAWGKPLTIEVDEEQLVRMYAMIREGQLRDIKPL